MDLRTKRQPADASLPLLAAGISVHRTHGDTADKRMLVQLPPSADSYFLGSGATLQQSSRIAQWSESSTSPQIQLAGGCFSNAVDLAPQVR